MQVKNKLVKFWVTGDQYQELLKKARDSGHNNLSSFIRYTTLQSKSDKNSWINNMLMEIHREVHRK